MTYSVVARDPATGAFGVAVQSHFFAVGAVVPWAQAGVGAVASQFVPETRYGSAGLEHMKAGLSARQALDRLLVEDPTPELRQVAMVDADGQVAVHSGARCIRTASSRSGVGWSVQGNLLTGEEVLDAMAAVMADPGAETDFPRRLLAALRAAEDAGGDLRGSQAAALVVVSANPQAQPDRLVDLRVDDAADPVSELERLLTLHEATAEIGVVLGLVIGGDEDTPDAMVDGALRVSREAEATIGSDNPEVALWRAVLLARAGRTEEARQQFRAALRAEPRLHDIGSRLADAGLISQAAAEVLAQSSPI